MTIEIGESLIGWSSGVKFKCWKKRSRSRAQERVNKALEWNGRMKRESTINLRIMREREKWCIRSWNSKIINLIVFSSVSYRISVAASCFTHHGHGLCLLFFVLLQFAGIGNIKKVCSMLFGVKSHVKFPNITSRAHTLLCTLNANYWDVIFVYAERDIISLCVYIIAKHHPMQCHAHLFICKQ